jgi:hypothetical protein
VGVDEARSDQSTFGFEGTRGRAPDVANLHDPIAVHGDIGLNGRRTRPVHQRPVANHEIVHERCLTRDPTAPEPDPQAIVACARAVKCVYRASLTGSASPESGHVLSLWESEDAAADARRPLRPTEGSP